MSTESENTPVPMTRQAKQWANPETRKKASEVRKKLWADPVYRERMTQSFRAVVRSEQAEQNIREGIKRRWSSPESHEKQRQVALKSGLGTGHRGKIRNPESRTGMRAKIWRQQVKERDNFTCTRCGTSEHLIAHHIVGWDDDVSLRYVVENGVTLCRSCHGKLHHPKGAKFSKKGK